jgi:hypothetical protein
MAPGKVTCPGPCRTTALNARAAVAIPWLQRSNLSQKGNRVADLDGVFPTLLKNRPLTI